MELKLQERIDNILSDMEQGKLSIESCLKESEEEQPALVDYLFQDEHDFLTDAEKNQLLFLFSILWNLKSDNEKVNPELLADLEEQLWEESEKNDFPYSSAHPKIEAIDDEIFAVIMDCADEELNELTAVGAQWILVKGFTLASVLTETLGKS